MSPINTDDAGYHQYHMLQKLSISSVSIACTPENSMRSSVQPVSLAQNIWCSAPPVSSEENIGYFSVPTVPLPVSPQNIAYYSVPVHTALK